MLGFDCLGGMTQVSRVEVEIKCAGKVLDFFWRLEGWEREKEWAAKVKASEEELNTYPGKKVYNERVRSNVELINADLLKFVY